MMLRVVGMRRVVQPLRAMRTYSALVNTPRAMPRVQMRRPLAMLAPQRRTMFIQTESTPNADSLKFLPGCEVMEKGTAEFLDKRSSMSSPLAKSLF